MKTSLTKWFSGCALPRFFTLLVALGLASAVEAATTTPVFLLNYTSGSDVTGWIKKNQTGGGDLGEVTSGGYTFKTSDNLNGNFNTGFSDSSSDSFAAGAYVDVFGVSHASLLDEITASLSLSTTIPAEVYNTGIYQGAKVGNIGRLTGLDSTKKYVIYVGMGKAKSNANGKRAAFMLEAANCGTIDSLQYVVTQGHTDDNDPTTAATTYTTFTTGQYVGPETDSLMIVRYVGKPNSSGAFNFKLSYGDETIYRSGINFLAVAEYDETTAYAATISESKDWTALSWSPAWPSGGSTTAAANLTVGATSTLTINENEEMSKLAVTSMAGNDLTLALGSGITATVGTYDFSAAAGKATVNYGTGTSPVTAGTDTVLTQTGTGTLTIGSGLKATVPAWGTANVSGAGTIDISADSASTAVTWGETANFTGTMRLLKGTWTVTAGGNSAGYPRKSAVEVVGSDAMLKITTATDATGYNGDLSKSLTVKNGGTLRVEMRDTFSRTLNLDNGKVVFNQDASNSSRAFDLYGSATINVTGTGTSTIGGTTAGSIVNSGIISLRNTPTITVDTSAQLDVYSQWGGNSGYNAWTKAGDGKMVFYRPVQSSMTGKATVSGGTVQFANGGQGTLGEIALASGTKLELNATASDGSYTAANTVTGAGCVFKVGSGAYTLTGASTYTGGTTVSAGKLVAGSATALGTGTVTVSAGATLEVAAGTIANAVTLSGAGATNNVTGTAGLAEYVITSGTFTQNGGTVLLNGVDLTTAGYKVEDNKIVTAATGAAMIGSQTYETVAAAFAAVTDGQTVALLKDCDETLTATATTFTLALGSHAMSGSLALTSGGAITLDYGTGTFTSTVTGSGTLITTALPTGAFLTSLTQNAWTGTLWLKYTTKHQFNFSAYGHANSKLKLTGVNGYSPNDNTGNAGFPGTIILADDGDTKAWTINDSYVSQYYVGKLAGDGSFVSSSSQSSVAQYRFNDVSEFSGTITLSNATRPVMIGSGSSQAENGCILIESGATATLASGKTWTVSSGKKFQVNGTLIDNGTLSTGTVTGSGTVVVDGMLPTGHKTDFQAEAWTGTVWIKNIVINDTNKLKEYCNDGSKIKVTGIKGYMPSSGGTDQGIAELVLADDSTSGKLALEIDDSSSGYVYNYAKFTGDGSFRFATKATSACAVTISDVSEFTGRLLSTAGTHHDGSTATTARPIYIGTTEGTASTKSLISVADGATIRSGCGWEAAEVEFGVTLTVKGAAGDTIVSGITTEPTLNTVVTLVDPTSGTEIGEYNLVYDDGAVKVGTVAYTCLGWDRTNSVWTNGTGTAVADIGDSHILVAKDGDEINFATTTTPYAFTMPLTGIVAISNQNHLAASEIEIPAGATLVCKSNADIGATAVAGAGTLAYDAGTATKYANNLVSASKLSGFSGTLQVKSGRMQRTKPLSKVSVVDGGQLYITGGTWSGTISVAGNGWTGETNGYEKSPLRIDGGTLSSTLTGGTSTDGYYSMLICGDTGFSAPANCQLTGHVLIMSGQLKFGTANYGYGDTGDYTLGSRVTVNSGATLYVHLNQHGGSGIDESDKPHFETDIVLNGGELYKYDGSVVYKSIDVAADSTFGGGNWGKRNIIRSLTGSHKLTVTANGGADVAVFGGTFTGTLYSNSANITFYPKNDALKDATIDITNAKVKLVDSAVTVGAITGSGNVSASVASTLTLKGGSVGGVISDAISLVIAGNVTLSGANTYTGTTTVNDGATLTIGNTNAIGSGVLTVAAGATVDVGSYRSIVVSSLAGTGTIRYTIQDSELAQDAKATIFTPTSGSTLTIPEGMTVSDGKYSFTAQVDEDGSIYVVPTEKYVFGAVHATLSSGTTDFDSIAWLKEDGSAVASGADISHVTSATLTNEVNATLTMGDITVPTALGTKLVISGAGRVARTVAATTAIEYPTWTWASGADGWTGTYAIDGFECQIVAWDVAKFYNGTYSKLEFAGFLTMGYIKADMSVGELILTGSIALTNGGSNNLHKFSALSGNGSFSYDKSGVTPTIAFGNVDAFTGTMNIVNGCYIVMGTTDVAAKTGEAGGITITGGTVNLNAAATLTASAGIKVASGGTLTVNKADFTTSAVTVAGTLDCGTGIVPAFAGGVTFSSGSIFLVSETPGLIGAEYTVIASGAGDTFSTANITFKYGTDLLQNCTTRVVDGAGLVTTPGLALYYNRLGKTAILPAGTYGDITLANDHGAFATGTESKPTLSNTAAEPEIGGAYTDVIKKLSGDTDTATHTIGGWFRLDNMPTGNDRQLLYHARSIGDSYATYDDNGYMVAVMADGSVKIGKTNKNAVLTGDTLVSAAGVIAAQTWYHIVVAVTKLDGERYATAKLFVNGAEVALTGTKFPTNLAGNQCEGIDLGKGMTVAAFCAYNRAITLPATAAGMATMSKYLAPITFVGTIASDATGTLDFLDDLTWTPSTPTAEQLTAGDNLFSIVNNATATVMVNFTDDMNAAKVSVESDGKRIRFTKSDEATVTVGTLALSDTATLVLEKGTGAALDVSSSVTGKSTAMLVFDIGAFNEQEITGSNTDATHQYTLKVVSGILNFTYGGGATSFAGRTVIADGSAAILRLNKGDATGYNTVATGIKVYNGAQIQMQVRDTYKTPIELKEGTFTLMKGCGNASRAFDLFDDHTWTISAKDGATTNNPTISYLKAVNDASEIDRTVWCRKGNWTIDVAENAKFVFDNVLLRSAQISGQSYGDFSIIKTGSGLLELNNKVDPEGMSVPWNIQGGKVTMTDAEAFGTGEVSIAEGATVEFDMGLFANNEETTFAFNIKGDDSTNRVVILNQAQYPWLKFALDGEDRGKIVVDKTLFPVRGLHFVNFCPKPGTTAADRDPNGRTSGWIDLKNYNLEGGDNIDLADYKIYRYNLTKNAKPKTISNLCSYTLKPQETIRVYTSEDYPSAEDREGDPDNLVVEWYGTNAQGKVVKDGFDPIMVIPQKINPKKYPMVMLYKNSGKDQNVVWDQTVVPCDIDDGAIVELSANTNKIERSVLQDGVRTAYGPDVAPLYGVKDTKTDLKLLNGHDDFASPDDNYKIVLPINPFSEGTTPVANEIASVQIEYRVFDLNPGDSQYVDTEMSTASTEKEIKKYGEGCLLWTGKIPKKFLKDKAGKLIQFRARITDKGGATWLAPRGLNKDVGHMWYGFVVQPETTTVVDEANKNKVCLDRLQTFLLFVDSNSRVGMDSDIIAQDKSKFPYGARVNIYDTQTHTYYDNVRIDLRGQTSASFVKKSHGLRFSKVAPLKCENPFEQVWDEDEEKWVNKEIECRKTSFVADYGDPTALRQSLSCRLLGDAGVKVPFSYPVRLYLNGEYYQLASHSNRFTDEFVEDYLGLSPKGYAYKNVGTYAPNNPGPTSGGTGTEKKTPDDDNESDMTVLNAYTARFSSSKFNEGGSLSDETKTALTKTVMTNFNIAAWVNYLAAVRVTQENDDVWTNIGGYINKFDEWDNPNGDDTLMPIAYDLNLSWGQWYYGDDSVSPKPGIYATNDWFKCHPFYGGWQVRCHTKSGATKENANYAYETLYQNEQFREMFLRRYRTLMDKYLGAPGTAKEDTLAWQWVVAYTNVISGDIDYDHSIWEYSKMGTDNEHARQIWDWPNQPTYDEAIDDMWNNYFVKRREHLYVTHSITNKTKAVGYGKDLNAGIPLAQSDRDAFFGKLMVLDKAGHNTDEAAFEVTDGTIAITNLTNEAIDLSGWKITKVALCTFPNGTVIPANGKIWLVDNCMTNLVTASQLLANEGTDYPIIINVNKNVLNSDGEPEQVRAKSGVTEVFIKDPDGESMMDHEAKIEHEAGNKTYYLSLTNAVLAAESGDEVKMLKSVTNTIPMTVKTGVDLDCNEFTLNTASLTFENGSKFKADTGTNLTVTTTFEIGTGFDIRVKTATTNGAVVATVPAVFKTENEVTVYGAAGYSLNNENGTLKLSKSGPTVLLDEVTNAPQTNFNGSVVTATYKIWDVGAAGYTLSAKMTIDGVDYTGVIDAENKTVTFTIPGSAVTAGNVYLGTITVTSKETAESEAKVEAADRDEIFQGSEEEIKTTGWINESVATFKTTGTWTPEPTTNETYIVFTDDTTSVFTPTTAQQGQMVVFDTAVTFDAADDFEEDIGSSQAGFKLVTDATEETKFRFAYLTSGNWVTNETVYAETNKAYTIRTTIDYHTYYPSISYDLVDGEEMTSIGTGSTGSDSNKVTTVKFAGEGKITTFNGTDYIDQTDARLVADKDDKNRYATIDAAITNGVTDIYLRCDVAWTPDIDGDKDGEYTIHGGTFKLIPGTKTGVYVVDNGDGTYKIISNYYEVMQYLADGSATNKVMYFVNAFGDTSLDATNVVLRDITLTNVLNIAKSITIDGQTHEITGDGDNQLNLPDGVTLKITGGYIGVGIDTNKTGALVLEGGKYTTAGTNAFVNCVAEGYHFAPLAVIEEMYANYVAQVIKGAAPTPEKAADEVVFPVSKAENAEPEEIATNYVGEVAFSKEWLVTNGVAATVDEVNTNAAAVAVRLNTVQNNKIETWENLVLGLDGTVETEIPVIQPVQTADPNAITFQLGNVNVDTNAGVKVEYKVWSGATPGAKEKSSPTATPDVKTAVELPDSGVKYYTIEVITTPAK